jgi:uncharacterized protein with beta-barrel porin domain
MNMFSWFGNTKLVGAIRCICGAILQLRQISQRHALLLLALFMCGSEAFAQQTVAKGLTNYTNASFYGSGNSCSGCHSSPSTNHLLASNNPNEFYLGIASGGPMANTFTSAPSSQDVAALALYIGQKKVPLPPNLSLDINGNTSLSGSIDVYPYLPSDGSSGVAQESTGGLTITSSTNNSASNTAVVTPSAGTSTGPLIAPQYLLTYNLKGANLIGTEILSYSVVNPTGTGSANLTVNVIGINSAATVAGDTTNGISYSVTTNGSVTGAYSASTTAGPLPAGFSISSTTGVITGAAGTIAPGVYPINVSVVTSVGTVSKSVTFTVVGISSNVNASGNTTNGFTYSITTNGTVTGAYSASTTAGPLPAGFSISSTTGVITGVAGTIAPGVYPINVSVVTTGGITVSKTVSVTIDGITSSGIASGTQNSVFTSYSITSQVTPGSYSVTGTLPNGLSLSGNQIVGTPTENGVFNVTVKATTTPGSVVLQKALQITITAATPAVSGSVTSANPATPLATQPTITAAGQVGSALTIQVSATNLNPTGTAYSLTSGNTNPLPTGLAISNSGLITWTPGTGTSGDYPVTINVNNSQTGNNNGQTGTLSVILRINSTANPVVNSPGTATGTVGTNSSNIYTITTDGTNGPITGYSVVGGTLPTGLNLANNVISGTPAAGTSGITTVTLGATNSGGKTGSIPVVFTIQPNAIPVVTTPANSVLAIGTITPINVVATNPPFTAFMVTSGTLPAGLSLSVSADTLSGQITGTTTTPSAATPISITATNAAGTSTSVSFSLAVAGISSSSNLPLNQNAGTNLPFQVVVLPAATGSYTVTNGSLPPGISLNATTGQLSGTPTTSGLYTPTISAPTAAGTVSQQLNINVTSAGVPVISTTPALSPSPAITTLGAAGTAISNIQINATNPPINSLSYTATGLPTGLGINTTTGLISGTPSSSGDFPVVLSAANVSGAGSMNVILRVNATSAPIFSSATTATGTVGTNATVYSITTSANGPVTGYAVASGTLPVGLTLNPTTGVVTGTPTTSGISTVTFRATNSAGFSNTLAVAFTIYPNAVPAITAPAANASLSFGVGAVSIPITATNPPFTAFAVSSGTLPAGLAISLAPDGLSGLISGTATTPTASAAISITATNVAGVGVPLRFNLGIAAPTPGNCTISTPLNTAGVVDLKPCMFPSANPTGMRVATPPQHGTAAFSGTTVTYTPANNYFGSDTFTAVGMFGSTSAAPATVTVTITGRPDPTKDAAVTGMVANEIQTALRFSQTQISNFGHHMEALRRAGGAGLRSSLAPSNGSGPIGLAATSNNDTGYAGNSGGSSYGSSYGGTSNSARLAAGPGASTSAFGSSAVSNAYSGGMTGALPMSGESSATRLPTGTNPTASLPVESGVMMAMNQLGVPQASLLGALYNLDQNRKLDLGLLKSAFSSDSQAGGGLPGNTVWVEGVVSFGSRDANGNTDAAAYSSSGISIGLDIPVNDDFTWGIGMGLARDTADIGTDGTHTQAQGYSLAAYGSYKVGKNGFVEGMLGMGTIDYDMRRWVDPMADFAVSSRKGTQLFGSIGGGLEYRTNGRMISPYMRLDFSQDTLQEVSETGAGNYALHFFEQTNNAQQAVLGLRGETTHATSFGWAIPRARVEWRQDLLDGSNAVISYADQIGGTRYSIAPTDSRNSALVLGLGSEFLFRDGWSLGLDYQLSRVSGSESSYALRMRLNKELGAKGPRKLMVLDEETTEFDGDTTVESTVTWDDNISRAKLGGDIRSDVIYTVNLSRTFESMLTDNIRLQVTGLVNGDRFQTFNGLSHTALGAEGTLQYRANGAFATPIWGLTAKVFGDDYQTTIRSGSRYAVGLNVLQPMTERVNLFSGMSYNVREANNSVFSTQDVAVRFNLDYALLNHSNLYFSGEFRDGDIVSSGRQSLENITLARAVIADDAYPGASFFAYRLQGTTWLTTLGYNIGLGARDSLDLSWRYVQATPSQRPIWVTSPSSYVTNQISASYLMRF